MGSDFYISSILPFAGIIIKICRAYTNNQADFEDYYQEVCLQIWRSKDKFRQESEWSTWIYRLSLNVCLTYLKKDKKNQRHLETVDVPPEVIDKSREFEDESVKALYTAIRQLSDIDRAVILLYLEELSYQAIADIICTNPNNIGVRIKRIKQRLNKLLSMEES